MDLSDLDSVKSFTSSFIEKNLSLNILINNAGIMACPESKTDIGWDLQFATNHIGHFVLTRELIERMDKTNGARVINLPQDPRKKLNMHSNPRNELKDNSKHCNNNP